MKGFWTICRNGITRIFKNSKEVPYRWWGKPMTGEEYEILEKYFESLDKSNTLPLSGWFTEPAT